jgi:dipeptidyl aminopeptidase/acylaminoacyl peptidase
MNILKPGLALAAGLAMALPAFAAKELEGDAITKSLLRKPEFEFVAISPDGSKLAIARAIDKADEVTVLKLADMSVLNRFDPGYHGRITKLRWLDDARLLVGATRIGGQAGFALFDPILVVATLDGKRPMELPVDFYETIDGDSEHLLVHGCGHAGGDSDCLPQIRRDEIGKLSKRGDLVIEGPADTSLVLNKTATAGFAIKWEDDDSSRTYAYVPADKSWKLINDGAAAGLDVFPIAVSRDGKTGYLQAQRKSGPDVLEKYDFATGERTLLHADPHSDPVGVIGSLDGNEVLGAVYEPTELKPFFWNTSNPDAVLYQELFAAFPGKSVGVVSRSKDNNLLVLGVSGDNDPGSFILFDRTARKARTISRMFPWVDPKKQATQRSVELKSRDGLPLHALLTLPPGSTGKDLPLVVVPHGGPYWIRDAKGFDVESQILAQHGYAVLQVNFRGSGGYGRSFLDAGQRQWGLAMQDDVTDATRWAIAEGVANPARICIYGASYGGYAALMGPVREPGLYKCAASYAGPSDLAKITRWDSQHRDKLSGKWFAKMLGEGPELDLHSPAHNADKIKVPVLLAHGHLDARVDVRHAQAMRKQLEKNGVAVDYIEYENTGHYLWLDEHREDFYTRLLRLLDSTIGPSAKG